MTASRKGHRADDLSLVHCRGVLARPGTIGAWLLIKLATDPETAIRRVRAARSGAIETCVQEDCSLKIVVGA